jgi:NADH:ubiquinone oxidoreductase subunit F (NADH-binding)/Pyruvate/2-oxoacid:ferredoxin oxidoreductase delta subunit/(2Fe-2S) ferredoxin
MQLPELLSWIVDDEPVEPAVALRRRQHLAELRRQHVSRPTIFVGAGTCGLGAGAKDTLAAIHKYVDDREIKVDVILVGCIGLCSLEPIVEVQLPGRARVCYQQITADKVAPLLDAALSGPGPDDFILGQHRDEALEPWADIRFLDEHPFFAPQTRWVLANCGIIDPSQIDEYIARGGYKALVTMLRGTTPEAVCDLVEQSGLRGRGGGGFPTGKKWKFARASAGDQKYLICNADEGDPGAFMDRAVIESDPHRLVEGMAIAAYAIGATKAYVYIRAEYPLAIKRLKAAIAQAEANHLLGDHILDTDFHLQVIIKMGAGAFVCGEETALIHSIEGRRGMPRPRPPFPAVSGLFGKPTIINNVETLANLPTVLTIGADRFAALGTKTSKGTKVFALSGKVSRTGLVEVAMGTPIRKIVFDIGGGIPNGKNYKAVQIGGPSGGCIPAQHLDIDVDYESLKRVGAIMGSGGLVVMDEDTCMVDVAKFFMDFIQRESCGKCIPCREGTRRMLEILQRVTRGRKKERGLDALERFKSVLHLQSLAETIRDTSLCGLGQTAPNPVLSTLTWFRDEYESHIYERKCPAAVCTELVVYSIDAEKCRGCGLCAKKCPAGAIVGAAKSPYHVVVDKCIGCGACLDACRFAAVVKE